MVTIKCARCKRKIFKYKKIGKGKLWHCWRERIIEDYSIKDGDKIKCECGNIIGIVQRRWIKLRQNSFIYSGAIENR